MVKEIRYGDAGETYLLGVECDRWDPPTSGFRTSGGVLLTKRCPLKCSHCITESSPIAVGELSLDRAFDFARILARSGRRMFFISGGEALMRKRDVFDLIRFVRSLGFEQVILDSSGFWAKDRIRTEKMLTELKHAGLTHIFVSSDAFHAQFFPFKNIVRIIQGCRELSLNYLIGVISAPSSNRETIRQVGVLCDMKANFRIDPISPYGRALEFDRESYLGLASKNRLAPCGIMGPTLDWNGSVHVCCNNRHPKHSPLNLGEFNDIRIENLLSSDSLLRIVDDIECGSLCVPNGFKPSTGVWLHDCQLCIEYHGSKLF